MQDIQHFIWDFDGTLFDTYPVIIENVRLALKDHGHDCQPAEAMRLMLDTIRTALDHYAQHYGLDRQGLEDAYYVYHRKANEALQAKPISGVPEVLEKICASGRHNYIFTHRKCDETLAYLKKYGLDGYFREIVGPESPVFAWKPAPDALLYLVEKYKMNPENTVMVGDRECDLGSGRNAGVKVAHLMCALAPEQLVCDWEMGNMEQMLALL